MWVLYFITIIFQKAGEDLKEMLGNEMVTFYVSPFLRSRLTYKYIRQAFLDEQVLLLWSLVICISRL